MPGTTPVYGFPYPQSTDLVADYPALGQDLAQDIETVLPTISGLMPATPTTIANSGGTATLSGNTVTLTGVTTVSLNSVFTTTYDHYLLLLRLSTAGGTQALRLRMRLSGTDNTSSYAQQRLTATDTSVSGARQTGESGMRVGTTLSSGYAWLAVNIFGPRLAQPTTALSNDCIDVAAPDLRIYGSAHNVSTAYDGFTVYNDGSVSMTGTVAVYGFKK